MNALESFIEKQQDCQETTTVKKARTKKVFLVITEVGRVKGRISFYIAQVMPNKGLRVIDVDYTCSEKSHRGIDSEAVQALVNAHELPITAIKAYYRNEMVKNYILILVQGMGTNYVQQINTPPC